MLFIITGCAPFGFLVLFDAVGQYLVKPKIFENNENRILTAKLEEVYVAFFFFVDLFKILINFAGCSAQ